MAAARRGEASERAVAHLGLRMGVCLCSVEQRALHPPTCISGRRDGGWDACADSAGSISADGLQKRLEHRVDCREELSVLAPKVRVLQRR